MEAIDMEAINRIRYQEGFNPFSYNFNLKKSKNLLNEAIEKGASDTTIEFIKNSEYFHNTYHLNLTEEIDEIVNQYSGNIALIKRSVMAVINSEALYVFYMENKYQKEQNELSAFNI